MKIWWDLSASFHPRENPLLRARIGIEIVASIQIDVVQSQANKCAREGNFRVVRIAAESETVLKRLTPNPSFL